LPGGASSVPKKYSVARTWGAENLEFDEDDDELSDLNSEQQPSAPLVPSAVLRVVTIVAESSAL